MDEKEFKQLTIIAKISETICDLSETLKEQASVVKFQGDLLKQVLKRIKILEEKLRGGEFN